MNNNFTYITRGIIIRNKITNPRFIVNLQFWESVLLSPWIRLKREDGFDRYRSKSIPACLASPCRVSTRGWQSRLEPEATELLRKNRGAETLNSSSRGGRPFTRSPLYLITSKWAILLVRRHVGLGRGLCCFQERAKRDREREEEVCIK